MNIYVSNLSYNTNNDSLQRLFAEFGEISSANIITDRETGKSRGFGFVEMPNDEEAERAIEKLNGTEFEGKDIVVNIARPKTDRSSGGGGYSRGGGYGGGGNNGGGYNKRRY